MLPAQNLRCSLWSIRVKWPALVLCPHWLPSPSKVGTASSPFGSRETGTQLMLNRHSLSCNAKSEKWGLKHFTPSFLCLWHGPRARIYYFPRVLECQSHGMLYIVRRLCGDVLAQGFSVPGQRVNIFSFVGHTVSVTALRLQCKSSHKPYINVWLCSNTILFMDTEFYIIFTCQEIVFFFGFFFNVKNPSGPTGRSRTGWGWIGSQPRHADLCSSASKSLSPPLKPPGGRGDRTQSAKKDGKDHPLNQRERGSWLWPTVHQDLFAYNSG